MIQLCRTSEGATLSQPPESPQVLLDCTDRPLATFGRMSDFAGWDRECHAVTRAAATASI